MSTLSGSSNKALSKLIPIRRDSNAHSNELCKYDFIVGDKVYIASNPDRIGTSVFNGTTKFSDGIWIGVALDKPFGKNNGVVQGVKYFQCDDNHGIFVRPNNLRHVYEKNINAPDNTDQHINITEDQLNNSNLPIESEECNSFEPYSVSNTTTRLYLGERVYVAGKSGSMHKNGVLRFLGRTEFSEGHWAGIELDNPVGKNDGSVNGTRYFSCKPQYGLFALVDKVKKMDSSTTKGFNRMESFTKNGSTESVSSVASNFSSASRTRARLGMNAVSASKKYKGDRTMEKTVDKNRSFKTNAKDFKDGDKTSSAMQSVLKEKEQHVEQLIREREIERIDLATATAKIEELEKYQSRNNYSFNDQKLMYDKNLNELQNTIYLVGQERDQLLERLEEEKKKVDDLLFRIEEKVIDESDLENKTEENESQIFELNEKLALEREMREQLENRLKGVPSVNDQSVSESKYITQIKNLEGKLLKLKIELNDEKSDSKVKALSTLLDEKDAVVNDLQDRFEKAKSRLMESKKDLDTVKKLQNSNQDENKSLMIEIVNLRSSVANLTEKLSKEKTEKLSREENSLTKETSNISGQTNEFLDLKRTIEILRTENKTINATLAALNEEIESRHREAEEKRLEINDLQQRCKQLEAEKLDYIKSRRSSVEENDKLVAQLSTYNEQLEKLRSQVSGLHNDNKRLKENKNEAESNEKNTKLELENLRAQINFLETENSSLVKSVHELENDSTQNSRILQMSIRIEDMESMIQELNAAMKSEKEQNMTLITKNATLHSDLEHYKQKRDDSDNIMYDQVESLKSINKLLESDKLSLSESMEAKNKELIVIRDRLLKISQENECLQENFNENNQKFERDKRLLNEKLRKTERQLDENERKSQFSLSESTSEKRKVEGKDQISHLKDAKENAEQQIGFLNNVIVKLEKKFSATQLENQSLKEKIKDIENGIVLPSTKSKKVAPPRLYCDVCEIFDSHDTDKCTIIDNQSTPSSPTSNTPRSKVKAKAPRLYCDICEVFDAHDTSDCQDQQTF